jgi:hypothetical protein
MSDIPQCTGERQNREIQIQMMLSGGTVAVQILASLYLCKITKGAVTIQKCVQASKVCNLVSFVLICSICFFLWRTVYSCYDSPMFAILLILLDFWWVGRGMRYKKQARYLRSRNLLAPPLLGANLRRNVTDLNAPEISDDEESMEQPVAAVAIFAQPVNVIRSNQSSIPMATDVKPEEIWETQEVV